LRHGWRLRHGYRGFGLNLPVANSEDALCCAVPDQSLKA
jgi:hypothetical protein